MEYNICINGLDWRISIVPSQNPELYVDGVLCAGTTWLTQQEIYLSADLNAKTARCIIAHELTHAYLWATQMKVPEAFTEEEVCDFVARWGDEIMNMTNHIYKELYRKGKGNGK